MADNTYKITNEGRRAKGFRVKGGIETVGPNDTRTLQLKSSLSKDAIEQFKEEGIVIVSASASKAEQVGDEGEDKDNRPPAETGGVTPENKVSEEGGVDRKTGTTTTTKPTTQQSGPKA